MEQVEITEDNLITKKIVRYIDCFDEKSHGQFTCLITGCKSSLSRKSCAIKHLHRKHTEIKNLIDVAKSEKNQSIPTVQIDVTPSQVWNAILQLIIFSALPLCIVQTQGFRFLLKPFITAFQSAGINFAVNRHTVRKQITDRANKIKEIITEEVKGKMVCLLLDIASRFNRSIFGINITFYANGKNHIRTIGMTTLKVSQTGQNLFDIVKKTLSDFQIELIQVFAVTTDNGKNLIKMTKIMANELENEAAESVNGRESDEDDYDDDDDGDDEECVNESLFVNNQQSDEYFDPEEFDDEYFGDLLAHLRTEFTDTWYNGLLTGINCAAHCLNLVVKDALEMTTEFKDLIDKSRTLVKKLRTPSVRGALREKSMKMAILDVKTRWSSLYDMVKLPFYLCFILQCFF